MRGLGQAGTEAQTPVVRQLVTLLRLLAAVTLAARVPIIVREKENDGEGAGEVMIAPAKSSISHLSGR
jgi:hypothetical protein